MLRKTRKLIALCALVALMMFSTTVMAVSVTASGGKTALSRTGTAVATGTKIIGCTIYRSNGSTLSHNAGNYASNGNRTCYTSYTGIYTAQKVYGFAEAANGKRSTSSYYY